MLLGGVACKSKVSNEWSLIPGKQVIVETKSGWVVKIKSRVFVVVNDTRVGSVTNCDKEKTEQKSRKSLESAEEGDKTREEVCYLILGKLKSPRRNN